jgi:hypothetical protein
LNIAQTAIGFIICRIQDHPLWPQDFARISQSAEAAIDIRQLAGTNGGFPAGTGGAAAAFAGCYATRFIYESIGYPCGAVVPYGDRGFLRQRALPVGAARAGYAGAEFTAHGMRRRVDVSFPFHRVPSQAHDGGRGRGFPFTV